MYFLNGKHYFLTGLQIDFLNGKHYYLTGLQMDFLNGKHNVLTGLQMDFLNGKHYFLTKSPDGLPEWQTLFLGWLPGGVVFVKRTSKDSGLPPHLPLQSVVIKIGKEKMPPSTQDF